jgi:hypothetical protein
MSKTLPQGWRRVRLGEVLEQVNRFEKVEPDQEYRLLGVNGMHKESSSESASWGN